MYWLRPFQIFDVGSWTKDKDKYEIHFLLISPPAESLPLSSYWDKDEGKDQMKFTSNCWKVVFDFERKTKTRKRQKFTSPLCMASPPSWSSPPSSYWAEQETKTMTKARKMGKYEFHFLLMYGFVPFLIFTFFWFFTFTFFFFFNFAAWTFPCFKFKLNKYVKTIVFSYLPCLCNQQMVSVCKCRWGHLRGSSCLCYSCFYHSIVISWKQEKELVSHQPTFQIPFARILWGKSLEILLKHQQCVRNMLNYIDTIHDVWWCMKKICPRKITCRRVVSILLLLLLLSAPLPLLAPLCPVLALPLAVQPLAAQQPVQAAAEAIGDNVRCQAPRHVPHVQSHRLAWGPICYLKILINCHFF